MKKNTNTKDKQWNKYFPTVNGLIGLIAGLGTIISTCIMVKGCEHNPDVRLTIGEYDITNSKDICIYYIIPKSGTRKYLLPFPFRVYNSEHVAVNNLALYVSSKMQKIDEVKGSYLLRIYGCNVKRKGDNNYIYLSDMSIPAKSKTDFNDYYFNVVDDNYRREFSIREAIDHIFDYHEILPWDYMEFYLTFTFDNISHAYEKRGCLICLYEDESFDYDSIIKKNTNGKTVFSIRVEPDDVNIRGDGRETQVCRIVLIRKY